MSDESMREARRRVTALTERAVAAARASCAAALAAADKIMAAVKATAAAKAVAAAAAAAAAKAGAETDTAPTAAAAAASADPAVPDERDEIIARLELEIEAERAKSAALDSASKALEFQLDVLERSYGKQLADARVDGDAAKEKLAELSAELKETHLELRRVTAVRDRLRDMYAFDGRRVPPELRERHLGDDDTIASLLSAAPPVRERAGDSGAGSESDPIEPDTGELISPELVFDPDEDRDD